MSMQFRRLGDSGLEVSEICLGTMMFGDRTDAATSQRIIASAFDAGVNFIDTADVYVKGASESIVGPAIAANRRRWSKRTANHTPTQMPTKSVLLGSVGDLLNGLLGTRVQRRAEHRLDRRLRRPPVVVSLRRDQVLDGLLDQSLTGLGGE